jgi:cytidylate kinase
MPSIVIVTGSPGTGKATVAALLAKADPCGLHLPADVFFTFPAHPISPYRPASREQNTDIMIALARTAETFASRGYAVLLDGIFGPWFLPVIAAELEEKKVSLDYVVLRAPLEATLERVRRREGEDRAHVVRQMHAEFADLGQYSRHAIETTNLTPEEIAREVTRRQRAGDFALDLGRLR